MIPFERLHNFRDLGGYRACDGRVVARGLVYRSDSLAKLAGSDLTRFAALQVRTVIDLRYPFEIAARGRVPELEGLAFHNISIEHQPYHQPGLDPSIEPGPFFAGKYAELAVDGVVELADVLRVIAAADEPLVFHCATGKDRTGIIAALVLSLLGVSADDIVHDYALTASATPKFIADWYADPANPPLRWPGYGTAPAEAMELFLAWLSSTYGSVDAYVLDVLDVSPAVVERLRDRLLLSEA